MPVGDDDTLSSLTLGAVAATDLPDMVAGRYKIVRWLGGGGMGRVYEARDTELHERVALKVLRHGLSADALERFRREVRITRRIQHPNVARMHDIGEHGADRFLTMELVDGLPLSRLLGSQLEWARLLHIATQICAGLAAAHDKGVIHRDLKPDNVLIERGTDRAVITDFGIARSVDDPSVTQVGAVVGTPRYMAPEQLGGREVDTRSDLFSFGVILYELSTGARPWPGDNAITIAVAQATQGARPITASSIPLEFVAIVERCLELDPDRRPATARELGHSLAAIGTLSVEPPTRVSRPSMSGIRAPRATQPPQAASVALAVLPVACATGDEYLADGVLDDLIDTLSATAGIRVRPAGVVRSRTDPDPRELGRQLDVDHVVACSLRRTPHGLRISARLIGIADGFQIWAHRADGGESEVLAMSEQLARGIASALSTRAAGTTKPTDPRAVDLYLRARAELRLFWGLHVQAAADLLDQAYEISPSSAPIAGARAFAATQAWVMSGEPALAPRARDAIQWGLATHHPEAYLASASYKFNTGDAVGGAADLGIALVRAPMHAQSHEMAGRILVEIAAVSEARHHFETARSLDPTRAHILATDLARLDALDGYWERADRAIAAITADPERSIAQLGSIFEGRLATWRGNREALVRATTIFAPRMGAYASKLLGFLSEAATSGTVDPDVWKQFLGVFGVTDQPHRGQLLGLQILSEIAMLLGKHELACETLEQADELGLLDVVILDKCPLFDSVANDARFRAVRERVRLRAANVLAAFRSTAG